MLSVLRVAPPVTSPRPPPRISPYSPLCKRAALAVVLTNTADSHAGHATSLSSTTYLKEVTPHTVDARQPLLLTQPPPICDIGNVVGDNCSMDQGTCASPAPVTFSFPVYGPFDVMYFIQNGAFASAWAAKDRSTGRLLCLKVFQSLTDEDVTRSVKTELRMFRRMVKSKGGERGKQFIIELSRSIQQGTIVLFAMELMTTDLAMYLCTAPDRCKVHARQWMAQIALGIESLHDMGILHRDIKSENIVVDSRENVRIVDFGLSYMNPTGEPLDRTIDHLTEFLGTPPYMAPEMLRNKDMPHHRRRCYGTAVDWWALGCILFELESETHQILFDVEEDTHTYVAWTQRPSQLEQTYSKFQGLDPVAVDLLNGLLRIQPTDRFCSNDMEKHEYFLRPDGTSEFDNAAARALDKPLRPELVPQFTSDEPIKVLEAAKLSFMYDWTNLKWA